MSTDCRRPHANASWLGSSRSPRTRTTAATRSRCRALLATAVLESQQTGSCCSDARHHQRATLLGTLDDDGVPTNRVYIEVDVRCRAFAPSKSHQALRGLLYWTAEHLDPTVSRRITPPLDSDGPVVHAGDPRIFDHASLPTRVQGSPT